MTDSDVSIVLDALESQCLSMLATIRMLKQANRPPEKTEAPVTMGGADEPDE